MKAARFYGVKDVRIEELSSAVVGKGEVKIEVAWCGLCGSDKHMYVHPFDIPLPVTLGHEFSGRIIEVGEGVTKFKIQDRVVVNPLIVCGKCDNCKRGYSNLCENLILYGYFGTEGGFSESTVVSEDMVIKIPDKLPLDKAALTEPVAIALHALRISQFKAGDAVAIFGAGPIGLFLTSLLKAAGAKRIYVIGHTEAKRIHAIKLGATRVIDPDKENVIEIIKEETGGGVNVAFELSGAQEAFSLSLDILRVRGEVVIVSLPVSPFSFDAFKAMSKELKVSTSQCSIDEFPMVVEMLANDMLNVEGMITKKIHLEDIVEEGFETLLKDKSHLKILVTPKKGQF